MEKYYELFKACNGVCTDTRKLDKDCLFICLSGERFNGNTFAADALRLGAKFVIADDQSVCDENSIFYVENSLVFLQKLANYHRHQFSIPIIGITGSNGKTSTKELVSAVLSTQFNVLFTLGNLNNQIGVPLTLLGLNASHELAVIEMGANRFRDIAELCEIAEPDYGIITNIGKAHLEGFGGFEGVLRTKRELYEAVAANQGLLFCNADDDILINALPPAVPVKFYGTSDQAELKGELLALNPYVEMRWRFENLDSGVISTKMIGKYNFYNFLAAACIGLHFGISAENINQAIQSYVPANNRSQIQKTASNTLILDAYNANPTSMRSALESFAQMDASSKIALLGDMFELGNEAVIEHRNVLNLCAQLGLICYFVGEHFYAQRGLCFDQSHFFKNKADFSVHLKQQPIKNQLILLKGSRGIGLEALVENL